MKALPDSKALLGLPAIDNPMVAMADSALSINQIPALFSTLLSIGFVVFLLMRQPGQKWRWMLVIASLATIWCSGQYLWVQSTTVEEVIRVAKYQYHAILLLPPVWCLFALRETGKSNAFSYWNLLFFIVPLGCMFMIYSYTPGEKNYLWQGFIMPPEVSIPKVIYGPLFWVMVFHNYLLIGAGCIQLYNHYAQSPHYRIHLYVTAFMPTFLLVLNALFITGHWPLAIDPTPSGFALCFCMFGWATFRRNFLELTPLARHLALDNLKDPVFILDNLYRVVDFNPAARYLSKMNERKLLGKPLHQLFSECDPGTLSKQNKVINIENDQHFEITCSEISSDDNRPLGKAVIFRDISAMTKMHRQLLETRDALQLANKDLDRIAHTDDLTGLANRRQLTQRLEEEVARAHRNHHPLALLFIDIDNFKQINDRYGHTIGDKVLIGISSQLLQHRKGLDIAARYGGEELVLVLTDTDNKGAETVATRLWQQIRDTEFSAVSSIFHVTVSIGVAHLSGITQSARDLVESADQALYHAKHSGKDRVCLSTDNGFRAVTETHSNQT